MLFYSFASVGGGLQTLTSRGQTPCPISTIFNRLPEGTIGNIVTENEEAALKNVGARQRTDLHTHTHTQTHRHDQFHDSCPSPDGQLKI